MKAKLRNSQPETYKYRSSARLPCEIFAERREGEGWREAFRVSKKAPQTAQWEGF